MNKTAKILLKILLSIIAVPVSYSILRIIYAFYKSQTIASNILRTLSKSFRYYHEHYIYSSCICSSRHSFLVNLEKDMSPSIFYGPYFLPIISLIFIVSGIYSLATKRVLIPPRNINAEWMKGR